MKPTTSAACGPPLTDPAYRRAYFCNFIPVAIFLCVAFYIGSPFIVNYKQRLSSAWGIAESTQKAQSSLCKGPCKPLGSEPLPNGIISRTSNLELRPIWGSPQSPKGKAGFRRCYPYIEYILESGVHGMDIGCTKSKSLLAMAVGIKQQKIVNLIVEKFFSCNFTILLFHYDGAVDEWKALKWSESALHVSAINQTKWWFAKRFLHPDIVAEYDYIFLWDEDLGVEHFHPGRYISIIQKEGLEISQPALDSSKSLVHHQITARGRKGDVHRRIYKHSGGGRCYENSTSPPCTGWVEMMAPVFSRAAWRCVWHMIQNDLIHAWGLDKKLGYCCKGDRTKHVGVVDREYIVHLGIPTLGASVNHRPSPEAPRHRSQSETPHLDMAVPPVSHMLDDRYAIRQRSFTESEIFKQRWQRAVAADQCWRDPYPEPAEKAKI